MFKQAFIGFSSRAPKCGVPPQFSAALSQRTLHSRSADTGTSIYRVRDLSEMKNLMGKIGIEGSEIDVLKQVTSSAAKRLMLCVLDIDETLLAFCNNYGQYDDTTEFSVYRDKDKGEVARPIEGADTIEFVAKLHQQFGAVVFATARHASTAAITEEQLTKTGISFGRCPIFRNIRVELEPDCLAQNGILYTYNRSKSSCLQLLLKHLEHPVEFTSILMVDDKKSNLEDMGEFTRSLGIPFHGFHYLALEDANEDHLHMMDFNRNHPKILGVGGPKI